MRSPRGTPQGITRDVTTSRYTYNKLVIAYPKWMHGSDGFTLQTVTESVSLGAITSMAVTNSCIRMTALSADKKTEYATLVRY